MTLVLLIGAGLLIHSFLRLISVSPGFESSGRDGAVQTVKVTLPQNDEPSASRRSRAACSIVSSTCRA